jgi:hypothetical protein
MGCFSFICQTCGRGVKSSSFSGEEVKLFLLKKGKIIQQMEGEYDSYGRVFKNNTQDKSVKHKLRKSVEWKKVDSKSKSDAWHQVCNLMHDEADVSNGIAAIHSSCCKGTLPTVRSLSDPNQGWGDESDGDEDLMGNTSDSIKYKKPKPIKRYDVVKEHEKEILRSKKRELQRSIELLELDIAFNKLDKIMGNESLKNYDKSCKERLKRAKHELALLDKK